MNLMTFFIMIAAAAVAVSLFNGVASMAHGGEADRLHSHHHMFWRTGLQAVSVGFVLLAMLSTL